MKTPDTHTRMVIADLRDMCKYGYDPYNTIDGRVWYNVAIVLGLPL